MDTATKRLKAKNLKVTPQRLAVYNILYSSSEHPSVDSVYKALNNLYPNISLATVYKTLETFRDVGLVSELSICRNNLRYDANMSSHCHLICKKCGGIWDYLPLETDVSEITYLQESLNFVLTYKETNFYGTCENCIRGDM